ncbi:hypothetical protein LI177_05285 [bacterium 210820-DFI.6.37]|nr:hypothetical protein [bacterium 210820-DFI.6.37]
MSVVNILDRVTDWAQKEICDGMKFKMPPDGDPELQPNAEDYKYEEATPTCFPLYIPTQEKLPPKVLSSIPSAVVRILKGEDSISKSSGKLKLDICFSVWNPGTYGKDIFIPTDGTGTFRELTDEEAAGKFYINAGGWRDAWNWVDRGLRALESNTNISGIPIDRETSIEFGPLAEQEAIPDFYPMWFAWISFAVKYPLMRNDESLERFL